MHRKILCLALVAAAATLMLSTKAQAWGAYHGGYTRVGPEGVQHYGRTVGVSPYGAYSGAHYGAYGAYGASRGGYSSGERHGGSYGGASYHYGNDSYGSYDRYSSYRRW